MANENLCLRNYAHIGDAIWEVFVRDYTILKTSIDTQCIHLNI